MPPHSSHLLQPLDVGCFGPLKYAYGGLVEAKMRLGFNHIDKLDFLKAYPTAHQKVFTSQNIQNSFMAAGIKPFDPLQVLEKLNISLSTPSPPSSCRGTSTSSSVLGTPHTAAQLLKKASSVKKILQLHSQSPLSPSKRVVGELIWGCESIMHQATMMSKELHDLHAENENTKQKRTQSKWQMIPNKGLSVQEGRDLITWGLKQKNEKDGQPSSSIPTTSAVPRRAPPTCSECHIQGHIRTNCPTRIIK